MKYVLHLILESICSKTALRGVLWMMYYIQVVNREMKLRNDEENTMG